MRAALRVYPTGVAASPAPTHANASGGSHEGAPAFAAKGRPARTAPAPGASTLPGEEARRRRAFYEEWVLLRRRELDAEKSRIRGGGCFVAGLLPVLLLVGGSIGGPGLALCALILWFWIAYIESHGTTLRINEVVDRYEAEAKQKRVDLGITEDFMRQS